MKKVLLYLIPILIVLTVAVVAIVLVMKQGERQDEEIKQQIEKSRSIETESVLPTTEVVLFFHDPDDEFLIPEKRNIYATPLLSDRAKQVVIELIRGPAPGGAATIPQETTLNELYILENGTACVDLGENFEKDAEGGSASQLSQIYSLVNSLTYNFPEIQNVRILINGEQRRSFGGHIASGGIFREKLSMVKFPESELPEEEEKEEHPVTPQQGTDRPEVEDQEKSTDDLGSPV